MLVDILFKLSVSLFTFNHSLTLESSILMLISIDNLGLKELRMPDRVVPSA